MTVRSVLNGGDASGLAIAIKAKTDNLPSDPGDQSAIEAAITAAVGALANTGGVATLAGILGDVANVSVASVLAKIDGAAVLGLLGANNSLAYRVHEIERHFHSYEKWFGVAATPSGTHKADRLASGIASFQIDGGNLLFGEWVQILGSADTIEKYDPHKVYITDVQESVPYFVQIAFGADADVAVAAESFTEFVYRADATNSDRTEFQFNCRRQAAGSPAWARCLALGSNTGTLNFYFGLHTYEG
jgi:hypothetical protein